jgi:trigger factor
MSSSNINSTVELLDDNKVKLSVEVDETEFDTAINAAFKRIAKEVNMPGFRPGKAPRKLIEAQFGHAVGREEALREALPEYYAQAVVAHDVDVIAPPDIEITAGQDTGAVLFDAVVEIRPVVEVAGYDGLRVEIPSPVPSDEEISEQLDRMREQYAEFESVERAADDGDHVTIDIVGTVGGEEVPGLTTSDYDYEVGSGAVVAEIDENLRGASVGDDVEFEAEHPDPDEEEPLSFKIAVKEVKEAVLPELNDEWAKESSEFESVDELRDDLLKRMSAMRIAQSRMALQQNTAEALAALVTAEVPEAMIESEIDARLQDMIGRLQQQGVDPGQYLAQIGQTPDQLRAEFREPAEQAVKVDLALRTVAESESLNPGDDKLTEAIDEMAVQSGQDGAELKTRLGEVGQLSLLRADLGKRDALEWLTDNVELIDEDGGPVDRALLEFPEESAEEDTSEEDTPEADKIEEDQIDADPVEEEAAAEGDDE